MKEVIRGFTLILSSISFIAKNPPLYPLIIAPLLINTLIFILSFGVVVFYVQDYVFGMVDSWFSWGGSVAFYVVYGLFLVLASMFAFFVAFLTAAFVASPFNDALSRKTLEIALGKKEELPKFVFFLFFFFFPFL